MTSGRLGSEGADGPGRVGPEASQRERDLRGNGASASAVDLGPEVKALAGAQPDAVPRAPGSSRSPGALAWLTPQRLRWILPLVALAAGAMISALLSSTRPAPEKNVPEVALPLVRTQTVTLRDLRLSVVAHGTVSPRTESDLVAEVRGRIVEVSPALVAGGFFTQGDALLRFDGREYAIAVDRARATLALRQSEARLASSEESRRKLLLERGAASTADLEQFESRGQVARAARDEARAALAQAELDLERTVVRAPFDGRVRERHADVGQFVNPGQKLARIHAVDYAEVRLPVRTEDLSRLELPLESEVTAGADASAALGAAVLLSARLGAKESQWNARLVRTEGEIDPRTRMFHVVARVDDPYARGTGQRPLPMGLFVRAEIQGQVLQGAAVLPAAALRDRESVYVVDVEDRLRIRPVETVRSGPDEVIVAAGLAEGERVVVSPLRAAIDGMRVRSGVAGKEGSERAGVPAAAEDAVPATDLTPAEDSASPPGRGAGT